MSLHSTRSKGSDAGPGALAMLCACSAPWQPPSRHTCLVARAAPTTHLLHNSPKPVRRLVPQHDAHAVASAAVDGGRVSREGGCQANILDAHSQHHTQHTTACLASPAKLSACHADMPSFPPPTHPLCGRSSWDARMSGAARSRMSKVWGPRSPPALGGCRRRDSMLSAAWGRCVGNGVGGNVTGSIATTRYPSKGIWDHAAAAPQLQRSAAPTSTNLHCPCRSP